jgi:hypothetical protein
MPDLNLADITAARAVTAAEQDRLRMADVALAAVTVARDTALARGDVTAASSHSAEVEQHTAARRELVEAERAARRQVGALADALVEVTSPEEAVGSMSGEHPVLLLPVRLETRFADDGTTLRVRIFPDQAHVTNHDPALTADEEAGLRWYWTHRWPDPAADGLAEEAWQELSARFRPGRAAFLVRAYLPTNLGRQDPEPAWADIPRRATEWSRAARAGLLPDRWCLLGFRRDDEGRHTEIFRNWGSGVPDTLAAGPAPDPGAPAEPGGLPDDPELQWLHNPEAAAGVGMLITVRQADLVAGAQLADGVDRLLAVGVDWTLDSAQAAAAVETHLGAHADEGRLAFVPQGTPTNSTGTARSGFSTDPAAARAVLAPHRTAAPAPGSAAAVTAAALGLAADRFAHVPGAQLGEQGWQRALLDALWPATGGYYLTEMLDPVADDPRIDTSMREHVVNHLRASGPVPTLRIGPQPYGILPVTARDRFSPTTVRRAQGDVHRAVTAVRRLVEPLVAGVPKLAQVRQRADVDDVLLALLQRTPVAWSLTFRQLVGPIERRAVSVYWDHAAAFQRDVTTILFSQLGCHRLTLLSELTHDAKDHPLDVPMVLRPEPTAEDPKRQGTGYLAEILDLLPREGGRELLDGRSNAVALLEAFLACAAVRELDAAAKAATRMAAPQLGLSPAFVDYVTRAADRLPYTLRVEPVAAAPAAPGSPVAVPRTPLELATTVLPGLTGNATIADHVAKSYRDRLGDIPGLLDTPEDPLHRLARYGDAVRALTNAPADQLEWAFRGVLDLYSTRLDAWVTSLASARLGEHRATAPTGLHVGGWGVVEDLRRDSGPAAESLGFLHAPSLGQAASIAVLRSARMSHRQADGRIFDLDLTSRRVRQALRILEGVAAGQRLAALLGYRTERGLQDRNLNLARWILPLRQQCPLRSDRPDNPDVVEPVEVVAARDVIDGVALLDRWAADRDGLLNAAGVTNETRPDVAAVLDDIAALADAVSDVLAAEAVHQATVGNLERSGAALAAHDRQGLPPDPEFVRTPRGGTTVTHRVGVWLPASADAPAAGWPGDLRSLAEPRLDRWLGTVLGDPARWQATARLVRAGGGAVVHLTPVGLDTLRMGALSLALGAQRPGAGQPSELEMRLAAAFRDQAERSGLAPGPEDQLEIVPDGLALVLDLAAWAAEVAGATPLNPADLASAADLSAGTPTVPATAVAADATARAGRVRNAAGDLVAALDAAVAGADPAALRAALLGVVALDGPDAVDPAADPAAVLTRVRAQLQAADAAPGPADIVQVLLGNGQPFLPVLALSDPVPFDASLADRDALLAGDPTVPVTWLHRSALVRPALDPLTALLVHAEADGADVAAKLTVLQSPHRPGSPWVALPFGPPGAPPQGTVGLVLHAPDGLDPAAGGAGLLVDAWTETIPATEETTAVSFHYDAPGARAPQTMLLAVHPDPAASRWDFDALVGSVHEAVDLARLRTVGSRELAPFSTFLPALFLPDSYTRDVPGIRLRELLEHVAAVNAGGLIADHVRGKAVTSGA